MPNPTVLSPSTSGQTGISAGSILVTQIARIAGGEGEAEIRNQALDCLNRARIELNQHDWRFMKTTDNPITLSNGTDTYTLSSAFRKPSFAVLIDAAALPKFELLYADDETFSHLYPDKSQRSQPIYYMLRNDYEDGLVTLFPTPDSGTAADYRLVVEYYARIEAFSDTSDPVSLPEEIVNVLVIGGQAYLLREREKNSPATVQAFLDYQRVKKLLLSDDRHYADEKPRFTLGTRKTIPTGTMLVRI